MIEEDRNDNNDDNKFSSYGSRIELEEEEEVEEKPKTIHKYAKHFRIAFYGTLIAMICYGVGMVIYTKYFNGHIVFETAGTKQNICSMAMFDISGNRVRTINNINSNKLRLEKGSLSKGIYFIDLRSFGQVFKGKIFIFILYRPFFVFIFQPVRRIYFSLSCFIESSACELFCWFW